MDKEKDVDIYKETKIITDHTDTISKQTKIFRCMISLFSVRVNFAIYLT